MADNRRVSIRFSGVGKKTNNIITTDQYHDGKMAVDYAYLIGTAQRTTAFNKLYSEDGQISYEKMFGLGNDEDLEWREYSPVFLNYQEASTLNINDYQGIYSLPDQSANKYSFYRREYEVFQEYDYDLQKDIYREYKGEWEPVAINFTLGKFRDFNIQADKTYQYIAYPSTAGDITSSTSQVFANYNGIIYDPSRSDFAQGEAATAAKTGSPVSVNWNDWSIIELIPVENEVDVPIIKKTYQANIEQMWFFKYSLETGSQTQNITRNEFQTLGQFPKFGFGQSNYVSGDVSALLGSEIRPYMGEGYTERMWYGTGAQPITTNERALMLTKWRDLIASKNPKLLRDNKGQSWIVQITGGSNSPKTWYHNQPDTISFQWKQVDSTDNVIIYGDSRVVYSSKAVNNANKKVEKIPMFKNGKIKLPETSE